MPEDPYANCRFYVEINGIATAVFTEVSGLQIETTVMEYEEGGHNDFTHRLPGRTKVSNLTLKRGMTKSSDFHKWCMDVMQGTITRRNVSVIVYDATGKQVIMRWNFDGAYPVKWVGPQFQSTGNAVAIETLELAHRGMKAG
jgi:phage tail-like protein